MRRTMEPTVTRRQARPTSDTERQQQRASRYTNRGRGAVGAHPHPTALAAKRPPQATAAGSGTRHVRAVQSGSGAGGKRAEEGGGWGVPAPPPPRSRVPSQPGAPAGLGVGARAGDGRGRRAVDSAGGRAVCRRAAATRGWGWGPGRPAGGRGDGGGAGPGGAAPPVDRASGAPFPRRAAARGARAADAHEDARAAGLCRGRNSCPPLLPRATPPRHHQPGGGGGRMWQREGVPVQIGPETAAEGRLIGRIWGVLRLVAPPALTAAEGGDTPVDTQTMEFNEPSLDAPRQRMDAGWGPGGSRRSWTSRVWNQVVRVSWDVLALGGGRRRDGFEISNSRPSWTPDSRPWEVTWRGATGRSSSHSWRCMQNEHLTKGNARGSRSKMRRKKTTMSKDTPLLGPRLDRRISAVADVVPRSPSPPPPASNLTLLHRRSEERVAPQL